MTIYGELSSHILSLHLLASHSLFSQLSPLPRPLSNTGPKSYLWPSSYQIFILLLLKLLVTLSLKLSDNCTSMTPDSISF